MQNSISINEENSGQNIYRIFIIILIGFLLRASIPLLAFSLTKDHKIFHSYDTSSYLGAALGLITTGRFVTDGIPETVRTPGYPILMVPGVWFGSVELVTVALQVLLGCVAIYLIYRVGLVLFESPYPALCSAGLYAIEPLSVIYTSLLMSETLFATILMSFVYYFLKYLKNDDWRHLVLSAIFLVGSAYIRPVCYFLPLLIFGFLLVRNFARKTWNRKSAFQITAFLLICYGLFAPWQIRNANYSGNWSFSGVSADDLYFFAASTVLAQVNNVPYEEQREQLAYASADRYLSHHPEQREWTANDVSRWRTSEALGIISSHPYEYVKMVTLGIVWTVGGPGVGSWLEVFKINQDTIGKGRFATEDDKLYYLRLSKLSYFGSIFLASVLGVYWLMAVVGGFKIYKRETWALIFLFLVGAYFVVVPAILAIGYSRFRHPVLPIICILGGYGLFTVFCWWRKRAKVSFK